MMNRRTLKEVQISEWCREVEWPESCNLSYFSHAIKFERLGTPSTGIPAKLISQFFFFGGGGGGGGRGTPYIKLYTVRSPQGVLFDCLEEINQMEMYFWG